MWYKIAAFILKYRAWLLAMLLALTGLMALQIPKIQWSYELMKIVPPEDQDMTYFQQFQETFGEDANMLVLGMADSTIFSLEPFQAYYHLTEQIGALEGINEVIALPNMPFLYADREKERFAARPLLSAPPASQAELDSLLQLAREQRFFEGKLLNERNGATVMLVSMDEAYLNSVRRLALMGQILEHAQAFSEQTGIELHFAGLPYVRSIVFNKVKREMNMFLVISIAVSALMLFLFFRSFSPVFYPLLLIGMVIVCTMGTLGITGFKVTMLTGLLPPVMVVIGIPNCIYLVNKYHQEFSKRGNKRLALLSVVHKIGIVTFITNTTTAIGFFVLYLTNIGPLKEFGLVASLNIMVAFFISIIFIPAVFSYLPEPGTRNMRHLSFKGIRLMLISLDRLVERHRPKVYWATALLIGVSFAGALQVKAVSFMVDDLPEDSSIRQDLAFFEQNFKGVMPLEIVVDTGKEKGLRRKGVLAKVAELEDSLAVLAHVTTPVSAASLLKAANQAYFDHNPDDYRIPSRREEPFILRYLNNQEGQTGDLSRSFVDSTGRYLRVSMKVADLGSIRMDTLLSRHIRPTVDSVLAGTDLTASITGTTLIFMKGNQYLIRNLLSSMLIAFALIAIIMGLLFGHLHIILISLIPNMVPLLVTAGLMGWLGIPLKPSTAIIFSIAFGISVDDSIHFLAKYRQELVLHRYSIVMAVAVSLRETGMSMIYTSVVLFFGFIIFVASDFGGTVALGALTSTTLLVAMITNLILLPSLLRSFDVNRTGQLAPFMENEQLYFEE